MKTGTPLAAREADGKSAYQEYSDKPTTEIQRKRSSFKEHRPYVNE